MIQNFSGKVNKIDTRNKIDTFVEFKAPTMVRTTFGTPNLKYQP